MMRKIFNFCFTLVFSLVVCLVLQSCYAFLQADKLIYSGNVFKKPADMHIEVLNDSVDVQILK